MPGKITELGPLTGAAVADNDLLEIADVSAGTSGSKSITVAEFLIRLRRSTPALSIKEMGAVGDSVTDDTAAIQAALDIGGRIFIPPLAGGAYYKVTAPLTISKPVDLFGAGINSKLGVPAGTAGTVDVIKVIPAVAEQKGFYRLGYFSIATAVAGDARHGVHMDLTTVTSPIALYLFEMDHVHIDATGGSSVRLTNPTNNDGFYASVIRSCALYAGIFMQRCGDSVVIEQNIITLNKVGIELSFVNGVAQCVVAKNNITSAGGAIVLHNGLQTKIINNQIEQLTAYTGVESASVVLKGDTAEVGSAEVRGNNINTLGNVDFCIDVQAAVDTIIAENDLTTDVADSHVRIGATASRTIVSRYSNRCANTGGLRVVPRITNAGLATAGPYIPVTVFSNGWAAWDAVNYPVKYSKDEAGNVTLEGMVSGGTAVFGTVILTLPAGYWPDGQTLLLPVTANVGGAWAHGNIQINAIGQVQYASGTNTALSVNVTYRAGP